MDLPERVLLHYRLISKIGQGGMGEVFKAETQSLAQRRHNSRRTPEDMTAKRRLRTRSTSALNHPNIVTIYD